VSHSHKTSNIFFWLSSIGLTVDFDIQIRKLGMQDFTEAEYRKRMISSTRDCCIKLAVLRYTETETDWKMQQTSPLETKSSIANWTPEKSPVRSRYSAIALGETSISSLFRVCLGLNNCTINHSFNQSINHSFYKFNEPIHTFIKRI